MIIFHNPQIESENLLSLQIFSRLLPQPQRFGEPQLHRWIPLAWVGKEWGIVKNSKKYISSFILK